MPPTESIYDQLNQLLQQIFTWCSQIVVLTVANDILAIFLAIFIVRKISKLLNKLL